MSEPEKREEDRAEGERRHLTSAERQKIYMERAAHKRSAALSEREKSAAARSSLRQWALLPPWLS